MERAFIGFAACLLIVGVTSSGELEDDPVGARLDKVEKAYQEKVERVRRRASLEIDRLIDRTRKEGDLDSVNRWMQVREKNAASRGWPRPIPTKDRPGARKAWSELLREYDRAKVDYTKAREIEKANEVAEKMRALRLDPLSLPD